MVPADMRNRLLKVDRTYDNLTIVAVQFLSNFGPIMVTFLDQLVTDAGESDLELDRFESELDWTCESNGEAMISFPRS